MAMCIGAKNSRTWPSVSAPSPHALLIIIYQQMSHFGDQYWSPDIIVVIDFLSQYVSRLTRLTNINDIKSVSYQLLDTYE